MADWLQQVRDVTGTVAQDILDAAAMYDDLTGPVTPAPAAIPPVATAGVATPAAITPNTMIYAVVALVVLLLLMR